MIIVIKLTTFLSFLKIFLEIINTILWGRNEIRCNVYVKNNKLYHSVLFSHSHYFPKIMEIKCLDIKYKKNHFFFSKDTVKFTQNILLFSYTMIPKFKFNMTTYTFKRNGFYIYVFSMFEIKL